MQATYQLSAKCNVFNIGLVMLCVLNQTDHIEADASRYPIYDSVGSFSGTLKGLIAGCLTPNWRERPDPVELLISVKNHMKMVAIPDPGMPLADGFVRALGINRPLPSVYVPEPVDDQGPLVLPEAETLTAHRRSNHTGNITLHFSSHGLVTIRKTAKVGDLVAWFCNTAKGEVPRQSDTLDPAWTILEPRYEEDLELDRSGLRDINRTLQSCRVGQGTFLKATSILHLVQQHTFQLDIELAYLPGRPNLTVDGLTGDTIVSQLLGRVHVGAVRLGGQWGIPLPHWSLQLYHNGILVEQRQETLRYLRIGLKDRLSVRQVGQLSELDELQQRRCIIIQGVVPFPTADGPRFQTVQVNDVDLNTRLSTFMNERVNQLFPDWGHLYVRHVNRHSGSRLRQTLQENRAVYGCVISVGSTIHDVDLTLGGDAHSRESGYTTYNGTLVEIQDMSLDDFLEEVIPSTPWSGQDLSNNPFRLAIDITDKSITLNATTRNARLSRLGLSDGGSINLFAEYVEEEFSDNNPVDEI